MDNPEHKYVLGQLVVYDSEIFRIEHVYPQFPEVFRIGNNVAFADMVHASQCIALSISYP